MFPLQMLFVLLYPPKKTQAVPIRPNLNESEYSNASDILSTKTPMSVAMRYKLNEQQQQPMIVAPHP